MSFEVLLSLGILSGLITTLVGVGGGMLMVVGLSFFFDIHTSGEWEVSQAG